MLQSLEPTVLPLVRALALREAASRPANPTYSYDRVGAHVWLAYVLGVLEAAIVQLLGLLSWYAYAPTFEV